MLVWPDPPYPLVRLCRQLLSVRFCLNGIPGLVLLYSFLLAVQIGQSLIPVLVRVLAVCFFDGGILIFEETNLEPLDAISPSA